MAGSTGWGGFGAVLAFLVGGRLFDSAPWASFAFGGLVMLLACAAVVTFLREPPAPIMPEDEPRLFATLRSVVSNPRSLDSRAARRDLLLVLNLLVRPSLLDFVRHNAFGVSTGQASSMLAAFALAIVIGAVPSGLLGARFGRKPIVIAGLLGFATSLLWIYTLQTAGLAPAVLALGGVS
ncbi:SLC45 family MFS transporter, partial [Candidatus Gracilibacteria bacterium]|nr:SLC45 family MFS transporter [Candidatus Gracilibacteria bacterium]